LHDALPICLEPTKETALICSFSNMPFTTSFAPFTTLNTPLGNPASSNNSTSFSTNNGVFSEGFITNVLPTAIHIATIHQGTIIGKLKGVIPPTTPTG